MLTPLSGSSASGKKGDRDSPLAAALKCAYHLMEQRIISNPKDMMGILLFGTRQYKYFEEPRDPNEPPFPHCYLLTDLDVPAAEDVRAIKTLVEDEEAFLSASLSSSSSSHDYILTPVDKPRADTIHKMLFAANNLFAVKAANFLNRRLFIITDNDNPTLSIKHDKDLSVIRAKDLYDIGATIELFPVSHGDRPFSTTTFYDDIVYKDPAAAEANNAEIRVSRSGNGLTLFASLISNINSRQTAKRALFSNVALELAPGLTISVNGYNVLHRQAPQRSCYIWLDGDRPQIAVGETTKLAEHSAKTIEKTELKKAYKFGGQFVYFSADEQKKELRAFGPPVIRVLGFKPRAIAIPPWASVAKSTFIFPSEADYVGSTRVFSALWSKLLRDDKVGIAWAVTRANSAPRLVAIVPSREQADDESGTPYLPAGLWLYPLPFADDVRPAPAAAEIAADNYREPSDALKDRMRIVVQQLQLPRAMYNPLKYPNPSLQWHYKILQALALQDEVPDKPDDATVPRYKAISKRAGGYIEDWETALRDETGSAPARGGAGIKREADDDDNEPPKKSRKIMTDKAAAVLNDAQMRTAVETGGVEKMTVVQLKAWLEARGMSTGGRKAVLLERIEEWAEGR